MHTHSFSNNGSHIKKGEISMKKKVTFISIFYSTLLKNKNKKELFLFSFSPFTNATELK